MDRKRERKKRERARQVGAAVLQQPRGRSDLIGCGSDSLNSSTTFQRARARGRARASTRQDTDVSRGKGAFARLLSSLPHYSIMMACGVCRTPFALIAPAPSPLLAHTSSPPRHTLSFPLLPNSYSYSFLPLLSIFSSIFPPLSTKRERERETSPSGEMHTRALRSSSSAENVFVGPSIPGSSTRTHRRDDDVRDITPAGERESPKV